MKLDLEQIKENIKCPYFGDSYYGKWGSLNLEQRIAYKKLVETVEKYDEELRYLYELILKLDETIIHVKEKMKNE